jgi:hypothetical protein
MNTNHDELERMLGHDLHRQVDGMTGVPFGFDDVKGRAGKIRRNRRIAAGVGVAAALAVIVPTPITAGGTFEGKRDLDPAGPSPDVPVEVARTTLTLDGLERGDAPAMEYFTPDGVVVPGQDVQPLSESYQALVPEQETGGWFALRADGTTVEFLDESFQGDGGGPATDGFTSTPDRSYVSWTQAGNGGQLLGVHSTTDLNGTTTWEFPEFPVVNPVGILGPDSVIYEAVEGGAPQGVFVANPDGSTTKLPYVGARAADPVNGVAAVQTKMTDRAACFAVVEVATQEELWETCDQQLGTFSPDGRYVMATSVESDGMGPSTLSVLDAGTGDLVAEFSSQGQDLVALIRPTWESADTIVAAALQGETHGLVRMGLDGTLEETVEPQQGEAFGDAYYWLSRDRAGF